jgi:hypothetical protein
MPPQAHTIGLEGIIGDDRFEARDHGQVAIAAYTQSNDA